MNSPICFLALCFTACYLLSSCGRESTTVTSDDYARAVSFRWPNINNKEAFNLHTDVHWLDGEAPDFWYVERSEDGKAYTRFTDNGKVPLFDHERIAEILSDSLDREVEAVDLPIQDIEYEGGDTMEIASEGQSYLVDLNTYDVSRPLSTDDDPFAAWSPDGKWLAYAENFNLFVRNTRGGQARQLTFDGRKGNEYATWYGWADIMEGETDERPRRFHVEWSDDSRYLTTSLMNSDVASKMYLLDWSIDTLYRPRLLGYYRGSPGDSNVIYMFPKIYDIARSREVLLDFGKPTHINSVGISWTSDPNMAIASYMSRGYQNQYLSKIDLRGGRSEVIYQENSETNIDNFHFRLLDSMPVALILSERSGWRQLYTLNLASGELNTLTSGSFVINDIEFIDEANQIVYFTASGVDSDLNPYLHKLYRIPLNGGEMTELTPEPLHHIISLSDARTAFVDNMSNLNTPTICVLRSTDDGSILDTIAIADVRALTARNWEPPLSFQCTSIDGESEIHAAIWRPSNFNPRKEYPVIDNSYTGPHTHMYPRDFRRVLTIGNQELAELGFAVVTIDGVGSAGRSKAFHNMSYGRLGENLADHVKMMREIASEYSWFDTSRVGIFGHSAGGYDAAHGLLHFPDFYDVGVASSADHDHRMEKAWWPEMYMGWPVDSHYHYQSNVTMAGELKGRLLITHGGIDENVNPSATFKLAEALIRADKQFDMVIFPSQRHGYNGASGDYFRKLRWNYFVEHLLDSPTQWDIHWETE